MGLLTGSLIVMQSILTQLRSEDESLQLDALNQLNELLAVSMADSLGLYPVEQLIPVLVDFVYICSHQSAVAGKSTSQASASVSPESKVGYEITQQL